MKRQPKTLTFAPLHADSKCTQVFLDDNQIGEINPGIDHKQKPIFRGWLYDRFKRDDTFFVAKTLDEVKADLQAHFNKWVEKEIELLTEEIPYEVVAVIDGPKD